MLYAEIGVKPTYVYTCTYVILQQTPFHVLVIPLLPNIGYSDNFSPTPSLYNHPPPPPPTIWTVCAHVVLSIWRECQHTTSIAGGVETRVQLCRDVALVSRKTQRKGSIGKHLQKVARGTRGGVREQINVKAT